MSHMLLAQGDALHKSAAPTRPVLRYPGGKWHLAAWIIEHFPPHRCYAEPFVGAGSVFMQKPRAYVEILNDLNSAIVELFTLLRDPAQAMELQHLLRLSPFAREDYDVAYESADTALERVRRLLICSWQGFNGEGVLGHKSGWRRDSKRRGTVPAHDWAQFPDQIARFLARLQGVIIEHVDALQLLHRYDAPDTLWYVDPPYDEQACDNFQGYGFTIDHAALAHTLAQLQGMVILSGYHSTTYDALYARWRCYEHRAYAGSGDTRQRKRIECLWLNAAAEQAVCQMPLL